MTKKITTALKLSLLSLLILVGFSLKAQNINSPSQLNVTGDATTKTNAIFCYGGDNFKLTASTDAGNGQTFDANGYVWVDVTNSTTTLTETSKSLDRTGLSPGYHTYRVTGKVSHTGTTPVVCQTTDYEEFTVYVLPPLDVTLSSAGNNGNLLYCENAVPTDLILTALPVQRTGLTVTDQFDYEYKWYKIVGGTASLIANANQSTYTISATDDATVGNDIKYKAVVNLKVKNACSYDSSVTGGTAGTISIEVTPKPNKPTISISNN